MSAEVKKNKRLTFKREGDLPATRGMLVAVHDSLEARIRSFEHETAANFKNADARFNQIDARFNQIDARFDQIDARFNQIDARFNQIDARFDQVDARFDKMEAKFERLEAKIDKVLEQVSTMVLMNERQRGDNRIVYEGLQILAQRQDRVEAEVARMGGILTSLAANPRSHQ